MTPSRAGAPVPSASSPTPTAPSSPALRMLAPAAGPLLIAAAVLIMTRGFWLQGRLSREHVDLLSFWLPRWCAMGKAVFAGHVPTWLPNQFGGVPFASDPQSGWVYLPVLVLFGATSCARALGLLITLNPLLAGLGMYAFFRGDRLSRPAATVGGLVMALAMAGSVVALSMPFAGALAWTAVALAGLSRLLHARRPAAVAGWLTLTALGWSQIAAAHLTNGLLIGTAVMSLYALARLTAQVRAGERSLRSAAGVSLLVAATLPVLAAAVLYPRLMLLPRTSIGQGYLQLGALTRQLGGFTNASAIRLSPLTLQGTNVWWGTGFARGPGGYVGASTILLIAFGVWSRRWRLPALAFAACGFAGWALNQNRLIGSRLHTLVLHSALGELWLRDPYRFRYLLIPAFSALAAYGLQAWLDACREGKAARLRTAAALAAGALVVFVGAPLVAGADPGDYLPFALGVVPALILLWLVARNRTWAAVALPVVLAVELTGTALAGQAGAPLNGGAEIAQSSASARGPGPAFGTWHTPWIDPASYLTPGAIGRTLIRSTGDGGRYLTFDPAIADHEPKGFLYHQSPPNWPAYANGRSVLFGLSELQGYSPVQLLRYWTYLRTLDRSAPIYYNAATFQSDGEQVLDLFGVEWVIQPTGLPEPPSGGVAAAHEGDWTLYRITDPAPRASLIPDWKVSSPTDALNEVIDPTFPLNHTAALEQTPRVSGHPVPGSVDLIDGLPVTGTASYRGISDEHARVSVDSPTGGVLLVRNPWDENWHATLDGKPVPLLHADYVMQGVAVPAGTHTVDLYYRDTAIGVGLWISGLAWMLLLVALVVLRRRSKPVRIEGVRVVLRPLAPPELDAWEESWLSMPQGASPITPSRDRLRERIARSGTWWGRSLDLAIEAEGRLIGQIGIYEPPSGALPEGVHQFGIMLFSPADRGKGFGTEAVRLLCEWLFREQSAARVEAGTLPANGPMRSVLARLGFVAAGTDVAHGVEYLLFALDRAAWAAQRGVEPGS